jgi:hypothetical protein
VLKLFGGALSPGRPRTFLRNHHDGVVRSNPQLIPRTHRHMKLLFGQETHSDFTFSVPEGFTLLRHKIQIQSDQSPGAKSGRLTCMHLLSSKNVSRGVSFFTTHLLTMLSVSSSLAVALRTLLLRTWRSICPDSVARPNRLPTQRKCSFSLRSSAKSPLRALAISSSDTPVSARHTLVCFWSCWICLSVKTA